MSGTCAAWEGKVDLSTQQYVQNVVTSTINKTSFVSSGTFTFTVNGTWSTEFFCPAAARVRIQRCAALTEVAAVRQPAL